ncbi:YgfZ/GcvT domain-containing protein [Chiayiivirga flava]|uniref:Folate-binding protein YgfZ n=1 Tax=Chiayiivirga flava TaxID=659595 RepID=A0A7W8D3U5_9GAMM|nr:folate-binding protein YgfZ [Chiayiivirga flava]MBB5206967.1 hypothetical protein [Chiayiivirga flava]
MWSKLDSPDDGRTTTALCLPDVQVLALEGRDAAAFAQAQFTGDVQALADLHWQWSAWLTPKGRVVALFQLLRLDPERYWAIVRDMPAATLAQALGRFVFRSKVRLLPLDVPVSGVADAAPVTQAMALRHDDGGVDIALERDGTRALRIGPAGADRGRDAPDALAAWSLADMAGGLPRLQDAAVEAYTPQMLGLDRLAAYSLKKGCYPGQEIVSRTHFLGQAKRGLVRVELLAPARIGERFVSDAGTAAEVVCSASAGTRREALLVAALDPPAALWRDADGVDRATPLPLQDSLLR